DTWRCWWLKRRRPARSATDTAGSIPGWSRPRPCAASTRPPGTSTRRRPRPRAEHSRPCPKAGTLTETDPMPWTGWVSEQTSDNADPHGAQPPRDRDPDGEAIQVALGHARGARGGGDTATEHVGQTTAATLVQQDEHDGAQAEDGQQDLKDELQQRQIHVDEHLPLRRADRSSIRHGPGP